MNDFADALTAMGVAPDQSAPPSNNPRVLVQETNTSPAYKTEPQMKATVSGDMGADPQSAIREINATQKQLASAPDLDPASRQMLLDHVAEMHRQLSNIPGAPAAPAQNAAPADNDFSRALDAISKAPPQATAAALQTAPVAAAPQAASRPGDADFLMSPEAKLALSKNNPQSQLALNQGTALASTIGSGYAGIAQGGKTLLNGGTLGQATDAASNTIQNVQNAGTFTPKTPEAQQAVKTFTSPYNPLNYIPEASQWAGQKGGDFLAAHGMPGAGAIVAGAGAAAPMALGLTKPISSLIKGAPEIAAPPRVEPTMQGAPQPAAPQSAAPAAVQAAQAGPKPLYKLVDGKPVLIGETPPGAPSPIPAVTPNAPQPAAVPISPAAPGAVAAPPQAPSRPAVAPTIENASPELQQAVAQAQAKGVPINQDVLNRHLEAETLPVPVKLTEGQATQDPATISAEMNGRGKGQQALVSPDVYNAQGKALGANLDNLRATAAPDVTAAHPTEMGQTLIDEYKNMDAAKTADITAKYKALADANGGNLPMSGQDFANAADAAMKKGDVSEWLPGNIKSKLDAYRDGSPMSFDNFENMRTILANEARKAGSGPSPDGNAVHAIGVVRNALESLPMSPEAEASGIRPLADAARTAARTRFQALDADPAYKAAANDTVGTGQPSPLADKFVQNYLINGKGANVKNMKSNLAGSDIANQTISAAGIDYLKGLAKADPTTGNFGAASFNAGLRQLGPKMGDMFDAQTGQHLQQVGNVAKYTTSQPKGSFVNNSNTATSVLGEAAKTGIGAVAEHGTNMAFGGIPVGTLVKKGAGIVGDMRGAKAQAQASAASVAPGAGMFKLSDMGPK